jgi:hypothetical protein
VGSMGEAALLIIMRAHCSRESSNEVKPKDLSVLCWLATATIKLHTTLYPKASKK